MLREIYLRCRLFGRYLVAGGPGSLVFYVVFYSLIEFAELYYVYSSVIGFIAGVGVTFVFQKFWAFENKSLESLPFQIVYFFSWRSFQHLINTAFLYLAVEYLSAWYLAAQILITFGISIVSFFIVRLIFTKRKVRDERSPLTE